MLCVFCLTNVCPSCSIYLARPIQLLKSLQECSNKISYTCISSVQWRHVLYVCCQCVVIPRQQHVWWQVCVMLTQSTTTCNRHELLSATHARWSSQSTKSVITSRDQWDAPIHFMALAFLACNVTTNAVWVTASLSQLLTFVTGIA